VFPNFSWPVLFLMLVQMVGCGGGGGGDNDAAGPIPVFIQLSPVNPEMVLGTTVSIKATAVYADNSRADVTDQVTWSLADDGDVVFISNNSIDKGRAYSLSVGSAAVVAELAGKRASTNIVVSKAQLLSLELSEQDVRLPNGTTKVLTVMGQYSNDSRLDVTGLATWSTADAATATVTAGEVATLESLAIGDTELHVTLDGISTNTSVSVTTALLQTLTIEPFQSRLGVGLTTTLSVLAGFSDGSFEHVSDQVRWASSDGSVAAVSNVVGAVGDVTARSTGDTTLTATLQSISASAVLTVTDAVLQEIMLSPSTVSLAKGTSKRLIATGLYSDNSANDITAQVVWSASSSSILDVANVAGSAGLVTALATGEAEITAALAGQVGRINVQVRTAELVSINVTPLSPVIAAGTRLQLGAVGNYSDGATQDLTHLVGWRSANTGIVSVTNAVANAAARSGTSGGLVSANGKGNTTVFANYASVSGSVTLTITDAALTTIAIDQDNVSVAKGSMTSLSATASFSDGSTQDYTRELIWQSSAPTIATISNADNTEGQVTALTSGTATITALLPGTMIDSISIMLTVTDAVLETITVLPQNALISNNTTLQFSATGHFSDGSEQDVTQQLSWVSSDSTRVAISNAKGARGLATGVISEGVDSSVTITARYDAGEALLQGDANVTVSFVPEKPVSLTINASPNVLLGNNSDTSNLNIVVKAAGSGAVVNDGTILDLDILQGDVTLDSSSISTVGGVAVAVLSNAQEGLLVLRVTVNETQISNIVSILVVSSFEESVLDVSTAIYTVENNIIKAGAKFIFYITNNSNREFQLNKYEFLNGNEVVGVPETRAENLNNNRLPGGATVGIVANLSGDLVDNGTSSRFTLVDPATGLEFTLSTTYNIVP